MSGGVLRLAVRVFVKGHLQSEERIEVMDSELSEVGSRMGQQHAVLCAKAPVTIELEFLDEYPSPDRFFRYVRPATALKLNPLAGVL